MLTRRQFVQAGTVAGAAALVPGALLVRRRAAVAAPVPGGTLDPTTIPKYVTPLPVVPAMPPVRSSSTTDYYSIAARQITQQILPIGYGPSTVYAFGSTTSSRTFSYPAWTIEARVNRPVQVTWWNQLMTPTGNFLPHFLPIDPTLHWANPPGGIAGRDSRPTFTSTPGPYKGPVPLVVHLHGQHSFEDSDGYPECWTLPAAKNIPAGYATVGSYWNQFKAEAQARFGAVWSPGNTIFNYGNDQRATALWYHNHDLGMTRVNIYAGLAGMYLLRGGPADIPPGILPGPAPRVGDPPGTRYYELPFVVQDKSFNSDGSIFFPNSRGFFGDTAPNGPWIPTTDTPPIWNPEFFGNTMLVNGRTWPVMNVEARRYRFRMLNACNARTVLMKLVTDPLAARPATPVLPMWVIGTDGGFIPAPVAPDSVRIAPSERMDVIIDFSNVPVGTALYLINEGPDEPFHGGTINVDYQPADPGTSGQVMKFVVVPATSPDTSTPVSRLRLPAITPIGAASNTRQLSLNELDSSFFPGAPIQVQLGTMNADGTPNPLVWHDPITETPAVGATEIWELNNFTDDGHPIHVHLVQFQVINRQPFGGTARPPESWETGFKDTVIALPGETTRIKATFDRAGLFVWHCHIVDHEDNEMMRPYRIG